MKWFAETTKFAGVTSANHVYLLDDSKSKMHAYRPFGTGAVLVFSKPIRLDTRGRKFVINSEQYPTGIREPEPEGRSWQVRGSKGDEYRVTELNGDWGCTCSGFKFRGQCRHIQELAQTSKPLKAPARKQLQSVLS